MARKPNPEKSESRTVRMDTYSLFATLAEQMGLEVPWPSDGPTLEDVKEVFCAHKKAKKAHLAAIKRAILEATRN